MVILMFQLLRHFDETLSILNIIELTSKYNTNEGKS